MWQWTRIPSTCQTGEIVWFLGIEESRSNRKKHRPESQEGPVEPRVGGLLGLQRKWKRHVGVRLGSACLSSWGQMRPVCFPLWLLPAFLSLSLSVSPPPQDWFSGWTRAVPHWLSLAPWVNSSILPSSYRVLQRTENRLSLAAVRAARSPHTSCSQLAWWEMTPCDEYKWAGKWTKSLAVQSSFFLGSES